MSSTWIEPIKDQHIVAVSGVGAVILSRLPACEDPSRGDGDHS